jgi:uncharacterized protein YggE
VLLMAYRASDGSQEKQNIIGRMEMQAPTETRTIKVTGTAEMLVQPDEISVDITYREFWRTPEQQRKYGIEKIEEKIVEAAKEAGVSAEDISIKSIDSWKSNWNYWYYWNYSANRLTEKTLTIQLSTAAQLTAIIKKVRENWSLRKKGILSITLSGSSSSKIQEYRKLVKTRAMVAAQQKASYLLESVQATRGRLVRITELGDPKAGTSRHYGGYGSPYLGAMPWQGWGYATQTSPSGFGVANATVAVPAGGAASTATGSTDAAPGMKAIRLQYSVEATYEIAR